MIDKRNIIIDAAEDLFAEHGFEGTSTRMLAAKANVNVAMISYYFGSKEKLFEALVEDRTRHTTAKLQLINEQGASCWEKIYSAIDVYIERIHTNNRFHKIIYREITFQQRSSITDSIREFIMRNATEWKKIIEDGQQQGEFREVDIQLTIASIVGTISQVTLSNKLTLQIMEDGSGNANLNPETHKQRLKAHLKELIKSHLKKSKV